MGKIDKDFIDLIENDDFIDAINQTDVDTVLLHLEKSLSEYSSSSDLSFADIRLIDRYLSAILSELFTAGNISQYADKLGVLGYAYTAGVLGIKELSLGTFTNPGSMFAVLLNSDEIAEKYKFQELLIQDSNIMDLEIPPVSILCESVVVRGRYGTKAIDTHGYLDIKAYCATIDTKNIAKSSERTITAENVVFTEEAGTKSKNSYLTFDKAFKVLSAFSDLSAIYLPNVEAIYVSGRDYHLFDDEGKLTFYVPGGVKIFSNENLPIKRI